MKNGFAVVILLAFVAACASGPPPLPYPAFVDVDALPNVFVAGLPGASAKQLVADSGKRTASFRVTVPPGWAFTTGASPGNSVEIYVLAGRLDVGEFAMTAGGYVYVPPGMPGLPISSRVGAVMLYFLGEANEEDVIRSPLITSSNLIDWQAADAGTAVKELRADPGSGARTWLMKFTPGTIRGWQRSSQAVEGYLLDGALTWSECIDGDAVSGEYLPGGYLNRPAGAINGGPDSTTESGATWFLRVTGREVVETLDACL